MFPEHKVFDAFTGYGYYTVYTTIFYWLYPKSDTNPFANTAGSHNIVGYRASM